MIGRLTRAAYLLILGLMFVVYAIQLASSVPEPAPEEPAGWMYS